VHGTDEARRGAIADRAEVIVLGAGVAGLSCADQLAREGLDVVVLEARDRVGGRTHSAPIGRGMFDLGGQWLGPGQERAYSLARRLGVHVFPTFSQGKKVLDRGGRITTYRGTIPSMSPRRLLDLHRALRRVERLAKQVPTSHPAAAARALEWDHMTVEAWKRENLVTDDARGAVDAAIRMIFGAEAGELSMLHFLFYAHAAGGLMRLVSIKDGAQRDRFVTGAQSLALGLADELGDRIQLSSPVFRLRQDADGVTAETPRGAVRGRLAVVAAPPAVAGRIVYEPALPAARDQLLQRVPMGATVKHIVTYDRPFWRDRGFSGEAVSTTGPVSAVFDNCSHDNAQPALLAFVVGDAARRWSLRSEHDRRRALLGTLTRYFGEEADSPAEIITRDWCAEPWTRGCPVGVVGPGALTSAGAVLRQPVGRLHFAGTETATVWNGYIEGALQSAERAAREVVRRLG
jgi:monoamine oxidase